MCIPKPNFGRGEGGGEGGGGGRKEGESALPNPGNNSINWPASSVWVFIAQLGEHCSANAGATGLESR